MTIATVSIEKLPSGGFVIYDRESKPIAARSTFTEAMSAVDIHLANAFREPPMPISEPQGDSTRAMADRFQKPAPAPPPGPVAKLVSAVRGG